MSIQRTLLTPAVLGLAPVVLLSSCTGVDYSEAFVVEQPVQHMVLALGTGDLELTPSSDARVHVERKISGWKGAVDLSTRVEDGVLYLSMDCQGPLGCTVDPRIRVPAGVSVEVVQDSGRIWVDGLDGAVDLTLSEGTVGGQGLSSPRVAVAVANGDVDLVLDQAPAAVQIAVGMGDVMLELPAGAYDLDARGAAPWVTGIDALEGAPVVDLSVGSGQVTVRGQ
jgi:hypothetical protein